MSTRLEPRTSARAPVVDPAVPDAVAPPPGSPRFALVDGARAVAALAILVTHTAGFSNFNADNPLGAWTARLDSGVAVFFVLSGFLLYRPWVAARLDGRPAPRLLRYARSRALRILPAYWVALTVLGLLLPTQVPGVFGEKWFMYYGLLQSWSAETILGGIGVAWSLSVEVAFYVLLPVVAVAAARALRGRTRATQVRLELWALAASAVVALVVRTAVRSADGESVFGNTLPGMWSWFAAGMALAVLSAAHAGRAPAERPRLVRSATERPWAWWLLAFGALTASAFAVGLPRGLGEPYTTTTLQFEHVLYGLMAVGLVAPAVFADGRPSVVGRVLGHPVLASLGLVSYGLFLYHLPLVLTLQETTTWLPAGGYAVYTLVVLAVATACAAASYHLLEKPLLRLKRR